MHLLRTMEERDEVLKTTVSPRPQSGCEVRRTQVELKHDKTKGFVEKLYREEKKNDQATTAGGKASIDTS